MRPQYILPALREGKLDEIMVTVGNISYSVLVEAVSIVSRTLIYYICFFLLRLEKTRVQNDQ